MSTHDTLRAGCDLEFVSRSLVTSEPTTREFAHTETICNLSSSRCCTIQRVESSGIRMDVVAARLSSASVSKASQEDQDRVVGMGETVGMACQADRVRLESKVLPGLLGLLELQDLSDLKVQSVPRVRQGLPGHRDQWGLKDLRVMSVHKVQSALRERRDLLGLREPPGLRDHKVTSVLKGPSERPVLRGPREPLEHRDHKVTSVQRVRPALRDHKDLRECCSMPMCTTIQLSKWSMAISLCSTVLLKCSALV